ncbi:GTP 3',8-cyclase [Eubacterium plexicaudatum ASF492]|uniref:Radical SAM core domain-containing protein n=1 Tax=Eubacterium plexicaudatum ASF492 TaxID=1235802 RepID=N2AZY1_9FIRM|nr:GTP 3',8-cyclase [Eubacterium plexicaudatum ASF492]
MNLTERYQKKLDRMQTADAGLDGVLVQIEVTNACNHKCVFCPNADSRRKKKMIDFKLAQRVMRECAEFLGDDKRICFHMNGEPLLYKHLSELVRYSKELGYNYSFLTTNGSLADEKFLTELFEAGLDSIKFSINAGSKETYKKIHGADDYDHAINALKFSWEYRKKTQKDIKIFVSCVGIKDNYEELVQLNELAKQYSDEVVFYYPCSYAGQKTDQVEKMYCDMSKLPIKTFEIKHSAPCPVLWNSINVTCDGYLSLCCSEADNRLVIEDLNHMSVKDAWMGSKMQRVRKIHEQIQEGIIETTPCYSCITGKQYDENKIDMDLFELALRKQ